MTGAEIVAFTERTPQPAPTEPLISATGFLFNEPAHLNQQADGPFSALVLNDPQSGRFLARCALFRQGDVAVSPGAAPFGSVEFAETMSPAQLGDFVRLVIEATRRAGCQQIQLTNYPNCYAPRQAHRLLYVLTEAGFAIKRNTPTYYLPVDTAPLTERMKAQERQRLCKSERVGLKASQWTNPCIPTVIDFLGESRRWQGYPLTFQMDELHRLLNQFPDQFPVFIVRDGSTISALCVCVRVRHNILYTFLPATNAHYRVFSPMVMLLNHLYIYCQNEAITLLDLGPALDAHHQPKPSLARFKQNMGAITSPKMTFELTLE